MERNARFQSSGKLGSTRVSLVYRHDGLVTSRGETPESELVSILNKDSGHLEVNLRETFRRCNEAGGRKKVVITLPCFAASHVIETVRRISRSAALNAKCLESILIETQDNRSYDLLRIGFGLPTPPRGLPLHASA